MEDADWRRMQMRFPIKLSKSRRNVIFNQSASHAGGGANLCVVNGRVLLRESRSLKLSDIHQS